MRLVSSKCCRQLLLLCRVRRRGLIKLLLLRNMRVLLLLNGVVHVWLVRCVRVVRVQNGQVLS